MRLWIEADFLGMAELTETVSRKLKRALIEATQCLSTFDTDNQMNPTNSRSWNDVHASTLIADLQKAVPLAYKVSTLPARQLQLYFVACVLSARDYLTIPTLGDLKARVRPFYGDILSGCMKILFVLGTPGGPDSQMTLGVSL